MRTKLNAGIIVADRRVHTDKRQAYVTVSILEMSAVSAAKLSTISRTQTQTSSGAVQPGMKCTICGQIEGLLRCSRCKTTVYCSKEHQKLDWKRHKLFCLTRSSETNLATASSTENTISKQALDCEKQSGVAVSKSGYLTGHSNLNEVIFKDKKEPVAGPSVNRFRGTYQGINCFPTI